MEKAHSFGFVDLDTETKAELCGLNSRLDPLMMRYQGMGWYDILVRHEKGYAIFSMGGENGYTAENNEKNYITIGDEQEFKSLDNLFESIKKGSWQEIVFQEEFIGGVHQEVRTIYPDAVEEDGSSTATTEIESSFLDANDMDDFTDPLKDY